jgi:hypothetical protein
LKLGLIVFFVDVRVLICHSATLLLGYYASSLILASTVSQTSLMVKSEVSK